MTATNREVLFVGDRCYIAEPGLIFDATDLVPLDPAHLASMAGAASSDTEPQRLLAARMRGTYLDYAAKNALATDRDLMIAYLNEGPAPAYETVSEGPCTWLPHPAFPRRADDASAIAELLLLGFGVLREADFLGLFTVPLKAAPSKGARHPFDACLVVGRDSELPPGVYRYIPSMHVLQHIANAGPSDRGVVLTIAVFYERAQWRYREVAGYCDLLLDLGHLLETVRRAAAHLRLSLRPVPLPERVPERPLVEEVVVAWRIDSASPR